MRLRPIVARLSLGLFAATTGCSSADGGFGVGDDAGTTGAADSGAGAEASGMSAQPDGGASLAYHNLCLKDPATGRTFVAVALDTCADSDCSGCCTQNKGSADELIDVELNTDARFMNLGLNGGAPIQWADMGLADPREYGGCN